MRKQTTLMIDLEDHALGAVLPVRAQPGAKRNAIVGDHNGALKVAVTQQPENGKANDAIIALLSKHLKMSKSSIELFSGPTNRNKRFLIHGVSSAELLAKLSPKAS